MIFATYRFSAFFEKIGLKRLDVRRNFLLFFLVEFLVQGLKRLDVGKMLSLLFCFWHLGRSMRKVYQAFLSHTKPISKGVASKCKIGFHSFFNAPSLYPIQSALSTAA